MKLLLIPFLLPLFWAYQEFADANLKIILFNTIGVEKKNIEASLTTGETIFRGLSVKPSALDQFNLPVEIKEGSCPYSRLH
jgi:hypothetical protein